MTSSDAISLPPPRTSGSVSVEEALYKRRSVRDFQIVPLTLQEVSQLVWAAQGVTHQEGHRTAPSAGALYPMTLYLVAGEIRDLPAGIYRYLPQEHRLDPRRSGDFRGALTASALHQEWMTDAAAILAFGAIEARTTGKYGSRGIRYVHLEAGHAAQNVLFQAVALGFGGTPVGAFDDARVARLLGLTEGEKALYLVPIGKPR